jgi:hypothetical protein
VARRCVFCEREQALTLEHVLPLWLGTLFPAGRVSHQHKTEEEVLRTHISKELDAKVRRVCRQCNTGWMHELEQATRPVLSPLILGRGRMLVPTEQEILSVWAVKTALMCEFLHPSTRGASREHFQTIYRALKPPDTANVWLAAYDGRKEIDYNHRRLSIEREDASKPDARGYLTALVLRHAVLFVMGGEEPIEMPFSDRDRRGVIQLHPPWRPFPRWPPEFILGDEGVKSFLFLIAPVRSTENG